MVLNTITVGASVTPTVVKTYAMHYLSRKPRRHKPTAHISYDEGLNLIRSFLHYASFHTVEEIQAFTSQWVPTPRWVKCDEVTIPETSIAEAAEALIAQLGHKGVDKIGGTAWWQWRREGSALRAEWIEMRAEYNRRKKHGDTGRRVMLYVHGGAYFFGSVDEHRYQMQRHARKLKARVFARELNSRYRLAPQFPFPCSLLDCLAAYMYLLTIQDPSTIILAGDSAGGGMIVSILVILRDRGLPLPAGAVLISPWVDLTHSFPSVSEKSDFDFIPAHGFLQRPSASWPPPNADDMEQIAMLAVENLVEVRLPRKSTQQERAKAYDDAVQGFSIDDDPKHLHPKQNKDNPANSDDANDRPGNTIPGPGHNLSIMIDNSMVEIKDQIQMYATNQLISHPLVSPVLQPSLGGLPPMIILTGGGEMLRDEQIYLAHKAANPSQYPPGEAYLDEYPEARDLIKIWEPTDVQLQVWDDLCHVAPTLSFTRPAKFMYRSIAQFGAWALARAQKTEIEILDDDDVSVISAATDSESEEELATSKTTMQNGGARGGAISTEQIGKAGDPLPPFKNHMIRQRVDRHGKIYPLGPPASLPALQIRSSEIGVIKPGPVRKWMAAKKEWDSKFAKEKLRVQKQRIKEMAQGFQGFGNDDCPPPSALAGRRGLTMPKEAKHKRSWGMSLWSLWGSSHDQKTLEREEHADREPETTVATTGQGANARAVGSSAKTATAKSRSRSRRRTVSDQGQTNANEDDANEETPAEELLRRRNEQVTGAEPVNAPGLLSPSFVPLPSSPGVVTPPVGNQLMLQGTNVTLDSANATRPKADGIAFPFSLGRVDDRARNASMVTLTSQVEASSPDAGERGLNGRARSSADGAGGFSVGETPTDERPGVGRFETAREEL